MRPRLRHGKPVGQRKGGSYRPIYICRCEFCRPYGLITTADGEIEGRCWYSKRDFDAHEDLSGVTPATPSSVIPSPPPISPLDAPIPSASFSTPIPEERQLEDDEGDVIDTDGPVPLELPKLHEIKGLLSRFRTRPSWEPTDVDFAADVLSSPTLPAGRDPFVLFTNKSTNSLIRGHLEWLQAQQNLLSRLTLAKGPSFQSSTFRNLRTTIQTDLNSETEETWRRIGDEWLRQRRIALRKQRRVKAKSLSYAAIAPSQRSFFVILILAAVFHLICNTGLHSLGFLLCVMRLVSEMQMPGTSIAEISSYIPKDMRTVLTRLDLETETTMFACCPRCFSLYDIESYPKHCQNRVAPKSEKCMRRLRPHGRPTAPGPRAQKSPPPVRSYAYQDLEQWIGWMYSRGDIQPWLDRPYSAEPRSDGTVHDIWDSEYLRTFFGPDGHHPFLSPGKDVDEGRLIFNLNADGFNPYGNRQAGKKVSIMGIYLVCMNLPPSLRHKPENVFLVGIVPGPKEPSMEQINYILKPLVDDLERLWETGMYVNYTKRHPQGRSVRAALVAVVCDMPAARLLGGFAHYRSGLHPCSQCKHSDLNDLDESTFVLRSAEEHRRFAEEWLEAETVERRKKLYKRNGVRYSELLRLKYWDPIQNTIVDSMHGFYLRMLQRHCRNIWRMGAKFVDNDGLWATEELTDEQKATAQWTFRYGSRSALKQLRSPFIRFLAVQEALDYRRNKNSLVESLLQMRVQRNWFTSAQELIRENLDLGAEDEETELAEDRPKASNPPTADPDTDDFATKLAKARLEYENGIYKSRIQKLPEKIVQTLAREYNVTGRTASGKLSEYKGPLVKALLERRDHIRKTQNIPPPPSPPPPPPIRPPSPLEDEDDAEDGAEDGTKDGPEDDTSTMLKTLPKHQINKLRWGTLLRICLLIKKSKTQAARSRMAHLAQDMHTEEHTDVPHASSSRSDSPHSESGASVASSSSVDSEVDVAIASDDSDTGEVFTFDSDSEILDIDENTAQSKPGSRKEDLLRFIHTYRMDMGITNKFGKLPKVTDGKTTDRKKTGVLGAKRLGEVRKDMARLKLPSWMAKAPGRPGEAEQGKFSADQWRAFCTINLPVTLIRLWGSSPKEERHHKMLAHYMHLVTAIRLANMRVMSEDRIRDFEENIRLYLRDLNSMYPHTGITIYQHMVLHYGSLLRRFGPVHSWRCFAFERLNYVLQQTSTNNKQGELELTMFRRFCMTQRLRAIFHGDHPPPYLLSLEALYQEYFENADTRGTRLSDVFASEAPSDPLSDNSWTANSELDAKTLAAVKVWAENSYGSSLHLSSAVRARERVRCRDLTFTTQTCSFPDSQVVFSGGHPQGWLAGSIIRIFTVRWTVGEDTYCDTLAQIRVYTPLSDSDAEYDPYRSFGFAAGRLFYDALETEPVLLPLRDIASHFGHSHQSDSRISSKTIHALPLNRTTEFDV